ncbi:hypothetical protein [Streptomyces uncialis]|uniref:Uncharacterized protein n=1 Tax=Streptomyces uncialis TaxID=1048205 RepID=A0A1Q4V0R4_9ACTN|nr:hypothetical protein [Streptomyces uncialis]OKH91465.1 hypothetical protein AB852_28305 [Streptomyces uncialis]
MRIFVDPLTAESVPDGTFGGARPRPGDPRSLRWTPEQQEAHYDALADAIGAPRRRPVPKAHRGVQEEAA